MDGWYPSDTQIILRTIMRAKLSALREGKILSDEEITKIDRGISTSAVTSEIAPAEEEEEEEFDIEEEEESNDYEKELNAQVDTLMQNLMKQPMEHQSIPNIHMS